MTTATAPAPMTGAQWLTTFLLLGTGFMFSVDFSILNVALPQVGASVGLELSQLPWIATAYALPAAGFTLLFGRISDLFGRRRMFLIGVALLAIASIAGGFATNPAMLLSARALQGFATAIATPAALSLLITAFSDERQRARVLGLNGALLSGGFTVGALVGGALVGALGWRSAFLINVPVAALILIVAPFALKASKAPAGVRLDLPGALAVTLGLLAVTFGVTEANLYALLAGLVLLAAFIGIELRAKAPLVALGILAGPTVKWGNAATLLVFSMGSSLVFLMTLYLQDVLHFEPAVTGLIFGVPGLASVVAGVVAGSFIGRHGARKVLAIGLAAQALFTLPLVLVGTGNLWLAVIVPALFLAFYGHVTAIVGAIVTATTGVPDTEQGLATGLATMSQQIGIAIGIPILGAVAATQADLLDGLHLALGVNVVLVALGSLMVWTALRPRRGIAGAELSAPAE